MHYRKWMLPVYLESLGRSEAEKYYVSKVASWSLRKLWSGSSNLGKPN